MIPASLCTFAVGDNFFAVDAARVREALSRRAILRVPLLPPAYSGLVLCRGEVLTTACLAGLLEIRTPQTEAAVIVLDGAEPFGLLADRLCEVVAVDASLLRPVPATVGTRGQTLLAGSYPVAQGLAAVVDVDALEPNHLNTLDWLARSRVSPPAHQAQAGRTKELQP